MKPDGNKKERRRKLCKQPCRSFTRYYTQIRVLICHDILLNKPFQRPKVHNIHLVGKLKGPVTSGTPSISYNVLLIIDQNLFS